MNALAFKSAYSYEHWGSDDQHTRTMDQRTSPSYRYLPTKARAHHRHKLRSPKPLRDRQVQWINRYYPKACRLFWKTIYDRTKQAIGCNMTDQCRQEFEKWAKTDTYPTITDKNESGKYKMASVEWAWKAFQSAWFKREENLYPVFDRLEMLLSMGFRLSHQDGQWHLFNPEGEGIACGQTFRALCVNIVLEGL